MGDDERQLSDAMLSRLRAQDAEAFRELVQSTESLVIGLCQAMGMRGPDLDDAAAEAFAEVYRSLPKFKARSSLSTWTYRIASRVIWRLRAERDRLPTIALDDRTVDSAVKSPAASIEQNDESRRVWAAVETLEPRQAAAVELYYRRDCSVDEIAEKLNCPANTVKTLLHRARAELRTMLSGRQ